MVKSTHGDPHAPVPGDLIGPWRIVDGVDAGSFGIIYKVLLASAPSTGPFAMKLAAQPGDPRFEREAAMLSLVVSPHVPRFHDAGTWNGHPYIVMQWVEGVPLYQWARATGRLLTSRQALRLLAQVARALEALHQHGLHRDVKGANVLVGPEGHVVLLDVGACWMADGRALTEGALAPGTQAYRSPEALAFRERFTEPTRLRGHWAWRAHVLARAAAPFAVVAAVMLLVLASPKLLQGQGPHEVGPPLVATEWHTPPVEAPDAGVGVEALASVRDVPRVSVPTYALGLPMPKAPRPGQRKPPCDTSSEVEVHSACWAILALRDPLI